MLAPIAEQSMSSYPVIAALGGSRRDRYGVCAGSSLCLGGAMLITGRLGPFRVAGFVGWDLRNSIVLIVLYLCGRQHLFFYYMGK